MIQKHHLFVFVMDKNKPHLSRSLRTPSVFLVFPNVKAILFFISYVVRSHCFLFSSVVCLYSKNSLLYDFYIAPLLRWNSVILYLLNLTLTGTHSVCCHTVQLSKGVQPFLFLRHVIIFLSGGPY